MAQLAERQGFKKIVRVSKNDYIVKAMLFESCYLMASETGDIFVKKGKHDIPFWCEENGKALKTHPLSQPHSGSLSTKSFGINWCNDTALECFRLKEGGDKKSICTFVELILNKIALNVKNTSLFSPFACGAGKCSCESLGPSLLSRVWCWLHCWF